MKGPVIMFCGILVTAAFVAAALYLDALGATEYASQLSGKNADDALAMQDIQQIQLKTLRSHNAELEKQIVELRDFVRNTTSSYARPTRQRLRTGRANVFVVHFQHALRHNMTSPIPLGKGHVVPLLLKEGKLLCRRTHISMLSGPNRIPMLGRSKALVEMIRAGLDAQQGNKYYSHKLSIGLPFLVMNGDTSAGDWCKTVPAQSYVSWEDFKGKESETSWSDTFSSLSEKYPWSDKLNKTVWRGTTTAYPDRFGGRTVYETPRGKLVQIGRENPKWFDVGFTRVNSRFAHEKSTLSNRKFIAPSLPFDDFMKYKAILDIDGNDWSSRFPKLLCSNSVTIKVAPLYIEHFYDELVPHVHYVPASLENLTQVTAYVLDETNDDEMKRIVESSNLWCQRKMTKEAIVKDAMMQLDKLGDAFELYMNQEGYDETPLVPDDVDDMVECIL